MAVVRHVSSTDLVIKYVSRIASDAERGGITPPRMGFDSLLKVIFRELEPVVFTMGLLAVATTGAYELWFREIDHRIFIVLVFVFASGYLIWVTSVLRRGLRTSRLATSRSQAFANDIKSGTVAVARIKPMAVAEVLRDTIEHGFQGKVFVFRLDEQHATVISDVGLTLLCDGEDKDFPNEDFEIIRLPNSKRVINIKCYGKRMTPQKVLPAKIEKGIYRDGEPFEIDWDAFLAGKVKI